MKWVKLYADFHGHPKTVGLSLSARGLWVTCLSWSAFQETGWFVPDAFLRHVGRSHGEDVDSFADELVAHRVWTRVEGGFHISRVGRAHPTRRSFGALRSAIVSALFERDGALCGICSEAIDRDLSPVHVDHIVPIARGGADRDLANLQLAHPRCNLRKGAR